MTLISAGIAGLGITAFPTRGQVPSVVLDAVVADIVHRTGGDVAAETDYYRITELRSQAVTSPDGQLGCEVQPDPPA